jgi:hypothetical protein
MRPTILTNILHRFLNGYGSLHFSTLLVMPRFSKILEVKTNEFGRKIWLLLETREEVYLPRGFNFIQCAIWPHVVHKISQKRETTSNDMK